MLGAKTAYIGSIGKDELGDFFENDMKNAGIKTILSRRDSPTGTAVALISPDYERTFATHLGAAVELGAADLNQEILPDTIYFTLRDTRYTTSLLLRRHAGLQKMKI